MEAVELYKRYRPKTWRNFIGQGPVIKSLQKIVESGQTPSAILFSGPRGCGKTSAAFVLAKALNCDFPTADSGPCNKCRVCKAIDSGSYNGVHYLSMANASGVDAVREIMSEARLNQDAKKTVYIIDEVHNSSAAAFDSLLIPLEETLPAFFIFCTTEPHKVPDTVMSRIQQRRFTLVKPAVMLDYVTKLAKREKLDVTDEIITKAVKAGRGSVRDTLTQLETIIETGGVESSYNSKYFNALAKRNLASALLAIGEAVDNNVPTKVLLSELFEDLKNLFLFESGITTVLIPIEPDELAGFKGLKGLDALFREMASCVVDVSRGVEPQLALEATTVRMVAILRKLG